MPRYDFDLACRALEHYAKKFEDFDKDEKEKLKLGNSFLEKDLTNNAKKTRDLVEKIKDHQSITTIRDNQNLIDVAYLVYVDDLEKIKESLINTLREKDNRVFTKQHQF